MFPDSVAAGQKVFVLVHGIGSHPHRSSIKVIDESLRALFASVLTTSEESFPIARSEQDDLPANQNLLHVGSGADSATLLELRWNPYAMSPSPPSNGPRQIALFWDEQPVYSLLFYQRTIPNLVRQLVSNWHIIALEALQIILTPCRPLARIGLAGVAAVAMLSAWAVLVTMALGIYGYVMAMLWAGVMDGPVDFAKFAVALCSAFVLSMFIGLTVRIWVWIFSKWALISDVVHYLSSVNYRSQIITYTVRVLDAVGKRYAGADLVLIGHSLGSVILSDVIVGFGERLAPFGTVTLVTAGSPLRKLSYLMPDSVAVPERVLASLQANAKFKVWLNVWRTRDFVGKRLFAGSVTSVEEVCAGTGPHWNYWSDRHVVGLVLRAVYGQGGA